MIISRNTEAFVGSAGVGEGEEEEEEEEVTTLHVESIVSK